MMIIEIEDRFCKAAQVFSKLLDKVECAANTWSVEQTMGERWMGERCGEKVSGAVLFEGTTQQRFLTRMALSC